MFPEYDALTAMLVASERESPWSSEGATGGAGVGTAVRGVEETENIRGRVTWYGCPPLRMIPPGTLTRTCDLLIVTTPFPLVSDPWGIIPYFLQLVTVRGQRRRV